MAAAVMLLANSLPIGQTKPPSNAPMVRPAPAADRLRDIIVPRAVGITSVKRDMALTMLNSKHKKMRNNPLNASGKVADANGNAI